MKTLLIISFGILFSLNSYAQDKANQQTNSDLVCKKVAFAKHKCKPEGRYSSDRNIYPQQDVPADRYNLNLNENNKVDKTPTPADKRISQQK